MTFLVLGLVVGRLGVKGLGFCFPLGIAALEPLPLRGISPRGWRGTNPAMVKDDDVV